MTKKKLCVCIDQRVLGKGNKLSSFQHQTQNFQKYM